MIDVRELQPAPNAAQRAVASRCVTAPCGVRMGTTEGTTVGSTIGSDIGTTFGSDIGTTIGSTIAATIGTTIGASAIAVPASPA